MVNRKQEGNICPTVFIVDDDPGIRNALAKLLEYEGIHAETYPSADLFLESYRSVNPGCLVLDLDMPGLNGLELQAALAQRQLYVPIIFLTGKADVSTTIQAFRAGAIDFLQKPASDEQLLSMIRETLAVESRCWSIRRCFQRLTPREQEIFSYLREGKSNKEIGMKLDISYRTVEGHRFRIMERMQADSLAELIDMSHALPSFPDPSEPAS